MRTWSFHINQLGFFATSTFFRNNKEKAKRKHTREDINDLKARKIKSKLRTRVSQEKLTSNSRHTAGGRRLVNNPTSWHSEDSNTRGKKTATKQMRNEDWSLDLSSTVAMKDGTKRLDL